MNAATRSQDTTFLGDPTPRKYDLHPQDPVIRIRVSPRKKSASNHRALNRAVERASAPLRTTPRAFIFAWCATVAGQSGPVLTVPQRPGAS